MKALLVVDHGSKLEAANRTLVEVAARLAAQGEYAIVKPAHMELAPPTIESAFAACVQAGATDITVSQFFLSPGRHSTGDIPRLVRAAASKHAGITWRVSEPLGASDLVVEALLDRAREASR